MTPGSEGLHKWRCPLRMGIKTNRMTDFALLCLCFALASWADTVFPEPVCSAIAGSQSHKLRMSQL